MSLSPPCDDQIEFTQAWREKNSSALTNEEWDHNWKLFVHARNPWGSGFAEDSETGSILTLCQVTWTLFFYLSVSLSFQNTDVWTTGNPSATRSKDSGMGWLRVAVVLVRSFSLSEKYKLSEIKMHLYLNNLGIIWFGHQ